MKIAVCIDKSGGMMFNNRRQSRDRILIEDFIKTANGSIIRISSFSLSMFEHGTIVCSNDFLDKAAPADWCFVEDRKLSEYYDKITDLIVYCWNRDYPSDFQLDLDLSSFELIDEVDFVGSSHDCITKRIYKKKG